MADIFISWSCHNELPQTEWPKQQKFIIPQRRRLEVQGQGVGRAMLGKELFQVSLLASGMSWACGSITPIVTKHSPCACAQIPPFYKETSHI